MSKNLQAGMTVPQIYKIMGMPTKVIYNKDREPTLLLFVKNKWFGRKEITKLTVNEGVLSQVNVSNEKPVKLTKPEWELR